MSSPEWTSMVVGTLKAAGYKVIGLQRTNGRGDGLLVAVLRSDWSVEDCQQLLFHDCGDRVAQLARLRHKGGNKGRKKKKGKVKVNGDREREGVRGAVGGVSGDGESAVRLSTEPSHVPSVEEVEREGTGGRHEDVDEDEEDEGAEVIVLNTHLLFPHDANSSIVRLCQVRGEGRGGEGREGEERRGDGWWQLV